MLKSIKVRLYPSKEQELQLNKLLGCYRVVYNRCLDKKITSYNTNKTSENLTSLGKYFHGDLLKDDNYEWLNEHNTKVLKQSIIDMFDATTKTCSTCKSKNNNLTLKDRSWICPICFTEHDRDITASVNTKEMAIDKYYLVNK